MGWLDLDRLQALVVLAAVLGLLLALCCLTLVGHRVLKVVTVTVCLALAAGGLWYHQHLETTRRVDCSSIRVLDEPVHVPGCPKS